MGLKVNLKITHSSSYGGKREANVYKLCQNTLTVLECISVYGMVQLSCVCVHVYNMVKGKG